MRVFMHCEGCARKVKRSLKGFDGVEDVKTDCRTHKVVVKGKKVAEDPMKAVQRVHKKTGRKPQVVEVVLKVHMHCDACAQQIKKRILRMKGVETAEPNLKGSQVTVKGVFDPEKLAEYVSKRTRKHAVVAKQEQAEKKKAAVAAAVAEEKTGGKEKMDGDAGGGDAEKKEEKDGGSEAAGGNEKDKKGAGEAAEPPKVVEQQMRNEFYQYHPTYPAGGYDPSYHPQMFSDENPNACAVM
ncbi:hypothetical protein ZIOFF_028798 [Zingiber officinale]|uniref:HMA domain-containing protein n=1 Tax=Zingiber officinale TaxID=94328 RepID=A0A8J5LE28_ZINOF|nr:hypothetical protein ZIOFF_028798 [Zingiber officinale]